MKTRMQWIVVMCLVVPLATGCSELRNMLIDLVSPEYEAEGDPSNFQPLFLPPDDERERIGITLTAVATGLPQITDIQFAKHNRLLMFVATKGGILYAMEAGGEERNMLLDLDVVTESEMGLLGVALHPEFEENGRFFVNYNPAGGSLSRVAEYSLDDPADPLGSGVGSERTIMEIEQPYKNHNAGQITFGPDGYLYVGWGDGGWRADPEQHGQNPKTLLGTMMRIDVDATGDEGYLVPEDNPFMDSADYRPEVWAYGLRNPWRYSFDPSGRLIVADVGQDKYEEISVVERGGNYGWNTREAAHCFDPSTNCPTDGLIDPVYEYGRDEGQSITGGFVYYGERVKELIGKYVFADFVSGRIWAIEIPDEGVAEEAYALGKWPILISTFGKDANGEIYIGDFGSGSVFRIDPD